MKTIQGGFFNGETQPYRWSCGVNRKTRVKYAEHLGWPGGYSWIFSTKNGPKMAIFGTRTKCQSIPTCSASVQLMTCFLTANARHKCRITDGFSCTAMAHGDPDEKTFLYILYLVTWLTFRWWTHLHTPKITKIWWNVKLTLHIP